MKFKKIEFKEQEKEFKIITPITKRKKITSRHLPILCNMNQWQSVGSSILDRFDMLEYEPIPKWYEIRGDIGESVAYKYIKAMLEHKGVNNAEIIAYTPQQFKGYDMFDPSYSYGNELYGGVPDIVVKSPKEHAALVEVKSKSEKDYDKIVVEKNVPQEEVMQALYLAEMTKKEKAMLVYVFFTPEQELEIQRVAELDPMEQELEIKHLKNKLDHTNTKVRFKTYTVDTQVINEKKEIANDILTKVMETKLIPKKYFNERDIKEIQEHIKNYQLEIEKEKKLYEKNLFDEF